MISICILKARLHMRILSGRTPVRTSVRIPSAIRFYVYTVKNPPRTFRAGDYVELELARKMSANSNFGFIKLVLLSKWTTIPCCYIRVLFWQQRSEKKERKIKVKRKEWIKGWLANGARKGAYRNVLRELKLTDKENYRRYFETEYRAQLMVASH